VTISLTVEQTRVVAVVASNYVYPIVGATYTYAAVSAILDTSGAFKYLSDQAFFADSKAYDFSKSLTDSFSQQEIVAIGFSTSASDSISFADSARRSTAKALADTYGASDALSFISQRNLQTNEVGILTDSAAKNFSKSLIHNIFFTTSKDKAELSVDKYLTDDIGASDSIFVERIYIRVFDEYLTITDVETFSFNGQDVAESINAGDSQLFSYAKALSDGVAMNDALGAGDGIAYTFATSISNVAFAADAAALSSESIKSETLAATDSGIIVQQDYVDLTYFAEDYVGVSYTF
jgi:hypothetical protein